MATFCKLVAPNIHLRCGGVGLGVTVVAEVITLIQEESVRLNPDKLGALYRQLGENGAEDVMCRAIEELAVRLSHCERLWRQNDLKGLHKSARSLIAISDQIGMTMLARVAGDVSDLANLGDPVALSATLTRLLRAGEQSLTAVWDLRDLSV